MSETPQIFHGKFDAKNVTTARPRDIATQKAIKLLRANPDYSFEDIKKLVGETYLRHYATGPVFDYILDRIVTEYIYPQLNKKESTTLLRKKSEYSAAELINEGKCGKLWCYGRSSPEVDFREYSFTNMSQRNFSNNFTF